MTGIILVLAANTAFNGFPVLGSILARDGFMPRALGSRGDRLAYSNGILILACFAIVLIVAFDAADHPADPALHRRRLRVVQPQPARHDPALDPAPEDRDRPGRAPADVSARGRSTPSASAMTAVVFVIVLLTKFLAGAWIAILAMGIFFVLMKGIRRHYDNVEPRARGRRADDQVLPDPGARDRAGLQAAQADDAGAGLRQGDPAQRARGGATSTPTPTSPPGCWRSGTSAASTYPLKVLYSPYREIIRPIVDYARRSATATRAAWSRSTSRSTSSAAGGSSCCTTRPRCGSRAGCCSPRASW